MRIAREEIFGPVRRRVQMERRGDHARAGQRGRIRPHRLDLDQRSHHRAPRRGAVEAGFVWINDVSKHFLGAPFGGYKQSGIGREECIEELLAFTQEKNIHMNLTVAKKS